MRPNYYAPGGGLGIGHLGQAADRIGESAVPQSASITTTGEGPNRVVGAGSLWALLAIIAAGLATYHGYRRSRGSVAVALGWGVFGLIVPPLAVGLAAAQGYARPAVRRNRRRRRGS